MPELTCVTSGCSQVVSAYQAEQTELSKAARAAVPAAALFI